MGAESPRLLSFFMVLGITGTAFGDGDEAFACLGWLEGEQELELGHKGLSWPCWEAKGGVGKRTNTSGGGLRQACVDGTVRSAVLYSGRVSQQQMVRAGAWCCRDRIGCCGRSAGGVMLQ